MKQLIQDYERRLKTVITELEKGGDDITINRLVTKAICYRTFLTELNRELILQVVMEQSEQLIIGGFSGIFSANKDYDKLFKDLYKEDKREGSVYPSLNNPEAVYHGGKWLNFN